MTILEFSTHHNEHTANKKYQFQTTNKAIPFVISEKQEPSHNIFFTPFIQLISPTLA